MSADKLAVLFGCTAKVEASYGAGGSLSTSTDGIMLAEAGDLNEEFAHDGSRASPPGTRGFLPRVPPTGSNLTTTLKTEPKGYGSAYSASNKPQDDVLLRICGHDAAVTTTGGAEKWVYTPSALGSAFASGVAGLYSRGSLWLLKALYGDFTWGADGAVIPLHEFALKGLFTSVADTAVPAITYLSPAVQPPAAANILFTIGGVSSLVVKKFQLKQNRNTSPRRDMNAGGHGGFSPGRIGPILTVTIEEPLTSLYDARLAKRNHTSAALSLQVGSVQYNREKLAAPGAQLIEVKPSTEESTATLDLTYQLNPSAVGASDEYSLTFD